jgi:hypothetical protein
VIKLRAATVISGTLMVFDQTTSEALLASLRRVGKRAPREVAAGRARSRCDRQPHPMLRLRHTTSAIVASDDCARTTPPQGLIIIRQE